jgi:hypothetical protein
VDAVGGNPPAGIKNTGQQSRQAEATAIKKEENEDDDLYDDLQYGKYDG